LDRFQAHHPRRQLPRERDDLRPQLRRPELLERQDGVARHEAPLPFFDRELGEPGVRPHLARFGVCEARLPPELRLA
jgi:hypothetical protein